MKLAMRNSAIFVILVLIFTGLLAGFTTEQDIVEDSPVEDSLVEDLPVEDSLAERSDPDAENWDIDALDTAKDADYLTGIEKDVVLETNKARTDPKKYAELYIQPELKYYKGKRLARPGQAFILMQEGQAAVEECVAEMTNTEPMGALTPEQGLSLGAKDHAIDQGKTGETGHTGSDDSDPFERIERYGDSLTTAGENIAYGAATGREIVIQLLVDDGVPDRGHRINIMKSDFAQTGVAFGSHPKLRTMCAISYAKNYRSNQETILARAKATE
jgi:hypothetical protein